MNIFKDLYQSELSVHQKMALDNCIALYTVGSNLYGTATSTSDLDLEGIFIEPPVNVLGFNHYDVLELFDGIKDIKLYSLQKFIAAALKNSPNKIESFYIPDNLFHCRTKYSDKLFQARKLFISKKVKFSFYEYAISQRRMLLTKRKRLDELREFQSILLRGISEGKTKIGELFTNNIFVSDIECKYNIY